LADRLSGVELTVSDNGTGFGLTPSLQPDHLGMRIMDRRASSVGGWVRVEPGLVGGTVVTCWVPLPEVGASRLERDQSAAS
jgi:signal transduction histidine kinase